MIVLFGSVFNDIRISTYNNGDIVGDKKIPITYSSKEKFIARLNSNNTNAIDNETVKIETILPRMCYNLVDMQYNSQFKTASNNFTVIKGLKKFNAVPYKFMFELSIFTRKQSDMFEILENILPYFGPNFCTRLKEYIGTELHFERDINITVSSISPDLQIEGDFKERRRIEWTIMFEMDGWLSAKPTENVGEIRSIILDFKGSETVVEYDKAVIDVEPIDVTKEDWKGLRTIKYE